MDRDLDRFRLQPGDKLPAAKPQHARRRLPRHKAGAWFLKGPIPGAWLASAAGLPGRSLQVALAVWHEAQLAQADTARLTHLAAARFGVSRDAARRALVRLEANGLVAVERRPGCAPRVIICTTDLPTPPDNGIIIT